ncbi:uncharacterized protein [Phaseolus vulgaris]|uniref:uncharacterized protein n=1 Tax=Phaseolus vulgaris TaxID=3885 RepID=UPI0035CC4E08
MKKEDEKSAPSYLYLHPSENPATPLVSPVLDPSNYHPWSRSMLTALSAKDKLEFVDGTATQLAKTDSTFSAWNRCNNMVVSWLVHSVSVPIRQSIVWMDKVVEIWSDLKTRYSQGDLSRISDLQMEASSLNQGELSITDYFTKLRVIWDELENFIPESVCICKNYTCNISSIVSQRKREDQAMQFLRGLNDQYSNVKSHVLLMEPVPPISKIFSLVAQQERQLSSHALIANIKNVQPMVNKNNVQSYVVCSFCGKNGHNDSVCFKKHGFPNQNEKKKWPHC